MLTARALFSARAPGFGKIGGRQLPSKSCSKSCIAWFASFRLDFFRNSAEWDLSFIATGAACYGSVFEQEISQPKPEPRYGLNMSTFFISERHPGKRDDALLGLIIQTRRVPGEELDYHA